MKIVHVINYFQPQLGYQEYFVAREHVKEGHDVYLFTSDRYAPLHDYENTVRHILGPRVRGVGKEIVDGIKVERLPSKAEQPGRRIWLRGLAGRLWRLRPDLVIVHGEYTYNSIVCSLVQKFAKYKLIVDSHSLNEKSPHPLPFLRQLASDVTRGIFKTFVFKNRNIQFVPVADACADFMIDEYGFKKEQLTVIPLGADTDRFVPDMNIKRTFRKELGLADSDIVILYTGKIVFEKDPVLIMEAIHPIIDKYPLKIIYVGSIGIDFKKRFDEWRSKMQGRITHVDAVANKDLPKYYQIADMAIWPKAASMSMIDAASTELPVIANDYLTERLKNNNGIGIKEGNIPQLTKAIETLAADAELRKKMGKNGREMVVKEMSWNSVAKRFLTLAESIK